MVRPPNVVLVVVDCLRDDALPNANGGFQSLPSALRDGSLVRFPRAYSTAPWTLPSHASLLSGLLPWDHGCLFPKGLYLAPDHPFLPSDLKRLGYRTILCSANQLISASSGLTRDFDQAAWGSTLLNAFRFSRTELPPNLDLGGTPIRRADPRSPSTITPGGGTVHLLQRFPAALDVASRVANRVAGHPRASWPRTAAWIEPFLDAALLRTPAEVPVCLVINLFDAHEPYLSTLMPQWPGLGRWTSTVRIRQDDYSLNSDRNAPRAAEMQVLASLYKDAAAVALARVGRLIQVLRQIGRWENTLFVLTSDHGQSFGEDGAYFHGFRPSETLLRVPLLLKVPSGVPVPARTDRPVSLIDILPTVRDATGLPVPAPAEHRSLLQNGAGPGPDRVLYAACERGLLGEWSRRHLPSASVERLDRTRTVAIVGRSILVYTLEDDAFEVYRSEGLVGRAVHPGLPEVPELNGRIEVTCDRLRSAARLMSGGQPVPGIDVEDRLKGWGYL